MPSFTEFFGTATIKETLNDKMGRVCNKLRTKDDKLVRAGIGAFRFRLFDSFPKRNSELGEALWKLVKGNSKAHACNVRSNSRDLAKAVQTPA